MAWIMDTYSMIHGHSAPGVVTGKPTFLGGSQGRREATARGCVFAIRAACKVRGIDFSRATVAIQGFGNAGSIAANLLAAQGATVIAVSDSHQGLLDRKGLDVAAVEAHKLENGTLEGYTGAETIASDAVLGPFARPRCHRIGTPRRCRLRQGSALEPPGRDSHLAQDPHRVAALRVGASRPFSERAKHHHSARRYDTSYILA